MKLTAKIAIALAVAGILSVAASAAVLIPALQNAQPMGIIGGADAPTLRFLLRELTDSAAGWLMIAGMLCLTASAVTAIAGAVSNKQ